MLEETIRLHVWGCGGSLVGGETAQAFIINRHNDIKLVHGSPGTHLSVRDYERQGRRITIRETRRILDRNRQPILCSTTFDIENSQG